MTSISAISDLLLNQPPSPTNPLLQGAVDAFQQISASCIFYLTQIRHPGNTENCISQSVSEVLYSVSRLKEILNALNTCKNYWSKRLGFTCNYIIFCDIILSVNTHVISFEYIKTNYVMFLVMIICFYFVMVVFQLFWFSPEIA